MLAIGLLTLGAVLGTRWYGNKILFPRSRLETWNEKEWPLRFTNGVSYVYDRPEADTVVICSHGNGGDLTRRRAKKNSFANGHSSTLTGPLVLLSMITTVTEPGLLVQSTNKRSFSWENVSADSEGG